MADKRPLHDARDEASRKHDDSTQRLESTTQAPLQAGQQQATVTPQAQIDTTTHLQATDGRLAVALWVISELIVTNAASRLQFAATYGLPATDRITANHVSLAIFRAQYLAAFGPPIPDILALIPSARRLAFGTLTSGPLTSGPLAPGSAAFVPAAPGLAASLPAAPVHAAPVHAAPGSAAPISSAPEAAQVVAQSPQPQSQPTSRCSRRHPQDIERHYACIHPGCNLSFGSLACLNKHICKKRHGEGRLTADYEDMRKALRSRRGCGERKWMKRCKIFEATNTPLEGRTRPEEVAHLVRQPAPPSTNLPASYQQAGMGLDQPDVSHGTDNEAQATPYLGGQAQALQSYPVQDTGSASSEAQASRDLDGQAQAPQSYPVQYTGHTTYPDLPLGPPQPYYTSHFSHAASAATYEQSQFHRPIIPTNPPEHEEQMSGVQAGGDEFPSQSTQWTAIDTFSTQAQHWPGNVAPELQATHPAQSFFLQSGQQAQLQQYDPLGPPLVTYGTEYTYQTEVNGYEAYHPTEVEESQYQCEEETDEGMQPDGEYGEEITAAKYVNGI